MVATEPVSREGRREERGPGPVEVARGVPLAGASSLYVVTIVPAGRRSNPGL